MWIDDQVLLLCQESMVVKVYRPESTMVVLGSSNFADRECFLGNCVADGVPVLKRYGGGGAVVLHDQVLVLSVGTWVKDFYRNRDYFNYINSALIAALGLDLQCRGLSDICYGDLKVAGTSMFRSRHYLLYQASLLYQARHDLMERYLRHPSKEPDYRQAKSHRDFTCGLVDLVDWSIDDLLASLRVGWLHYLNKSLAGELVPVVEKEVGHILAKGGGGSRC